MLNVRSKGHRVTGATFPTAEKTVLAKLMLMDLITTSMMLPAGADTTQQRVKQREGYESISTTYIIYRP